MMGKKQMTNISEGHRWGRWIWTRKQTLEGLIIELEGGVESIDIIGLREEFSWRKELVAKAPGITPQDLKDLERARNDLLSGGLL